MNIKDDKNRKIIIIYTMDRIIDSYIDKDAEESFIKKNYKKQLKEIENFVKIMNEKKRILKELEDEDEEYKKHIKDEFMQKDMKRKINLVWIREMLNDYGISSSDDDESDDGVIVGKGIKEKKDKELEDFYKKKSDYNDMFINMRVDFIKRHRMSVKEATEETIKELEKEGIYEPVDPRTKVVKREVKKEVRQKNKEVKESKTKEVKDSKIKVVIVYGDEKMVEEYDRDDVDVFNHYKQRIKNIKITLGRRSKDLMHQRVIPVTVKFLNKDGKIKKERTYNFDSLLLSKFNNDDYKVITKVVVKYEHDISNIEESPLVKLSEYSLYGKKGKPELIEEKKVSRTKFKNYEKPNLTLNDVGLYFLKRSHKNVKGKGFDEIEPIEFLMDNF